MPFAYYARLGPRQKLIYRQSDAVASIALPAPEGVRVRIATLATALESENRALVEATCQELSNRVLDQLGVSRTRVAVLAVRPSRRWGELHGLYDPTRGKAEVTISLWMRTARQQRVVALRTFLRTLLHEICHHLDYEYLMLADSFHTQGFYQRESSLFRQIWPEAPQGGAGADDTLERPR
jgi:hypothetical protein